jgi:hypothetical protein
MVDPEKANRGEMGGMQTTLFCCCKWEKTDCLEKKQGIVHDRILRTVTSLPQPGATQPRVLVQYEYKESSYKSLARFIEANRCPPLCLLTPCPGSPFIRVYGEAEMDTHSPPHPLAEKKVFGLGDLLHSMQQWLHWFPLCFPLACLFFVQR